MTSDAEMHARYSPKGYDGRWSPATKLSLLALSAEQLPLYLNYLWACTPQDFRCPICQRSKPALLRKLSNKVIAYLCVDHDHIIDFIDEQARLRSIHGNLRTLYQRYMSFPPLITCNQCNLIDATIKGKLSGIHPRFTFAPFHKAVLFKPYKSYHHWVNLARAEKIWKNEEHNFLQRLSAITDDLTLLSSAPDSAWWSYHRFIDEQLKQAFIHHYPSASFAEYYEFIQRSTAQGETY